MNGTRQQGEKVAIEQGSQNVPQLALLPYNNIKRRREVSIR